MICLDDGRHEEWICFEKGHEKRVVEWRFPDELDDCFGWDGAAIHLSLFLHVNSSVHSISPTSDLYLHEPEPDSPASRVDEENLSRDFRIFSNSSAFKP